MTRSHTVYVLLMIAALLLPARPSGAAELEHPFKGDPYESQISPTLAIPAAEQQKKFHLPPGFEIQLVAAEPDIQKPFNIAFDAKGRLWTTGSYEYPHPAAPEAEHRDRITILDDFDENGRARKITTFATGLNIPIGLLPMNDGAIVWSIPNIWRLYDHDGDDREDERVKLYGPFDHKDTHGNVSSFNWGFDGWIYATHGFANDSRVKGGDGHEVHMHSGHTFRFKPDGSRLEVYAHGQVNPFGITLDPLGNVYTADCHTRPIYQILHNGYYPSFGKPHDGLGFAPEICDYDHGGTGVAGISYYAADHFPGEFQEHVFTGNVMTCVVNHDRIERQGGSFKAFKESDFITSDDPWFRPVCIQTGPDGALYIADFYNRVIGHYEVPLDHKARDKERGRIWRVVYTGQGGERNPQSPRADWTSATTSELITDLAHANLQVRLQATHQLVHRIGQAAITPLQDMLDNQPGPFEAVHGLWALHRLGAIDTQTLARCAVHEDFRVRAHVFRILAARKDFDGGDRKIAFKGMKDPDRFVVRNAADALRLHPSPDHLPVLVAALQECPENDHLLRHVLRMSIRDQLNLPESWEAANALSDRKEYLDIILDVSRGSHTSEAAAFTLKHLHHTDLNVVLERLKHLGQFLDENRYDDVLEYIVNRQRDELHIQFLMIKLFHEGLQKRGKDLPPALLAHCEILCGEALDSGNSERIDKAIELIRHLRLDKYEQQLVHICRSASEPEASRRTAGDALLKINAAGHLPVIAELIAGTNEPTPLRKWAAELLCRHPNEQSVKVLADALLTAPAELATSIASSLACSDIGAARLFELVRQGKASPRLLTERDVYDRLTNSKTPNVDETIEALTKGMPTLDDHIRELMAKRKQGYQSASTDPALGAKVFKETCAACHRIGDVGNKIAPELDGIGMRGLDRLLDDNLVHIRNDDNAHRTTILELYDGEIITGLFKTEDEHTLTLADAAGELFPVQKDDIEERRLSALSAMPSNIAEALPEQDFHNLMAFLLQQLPRKNN